MDSEKEVLLTQEGYDNLEKELEYLTTEKRAEIAERIKVALGFGDLSENSEYDEAKNAQAANETKIAELEKYRINREAIIVNIGENVKYDEPCFDGVNINYFKISCPDEYLERFEQVGSQFDLAQMYESILLQDRVDKTKLEAVYSRIKEDNIKIVELIGNNGPISDQELQKIHIQNLDKMRKLV